jgi:hypothetical protein
VAVSRASPTSASRTFCSRSSLSIRYTSMGRAYAPEGGNLPVPQSRIRISRPSMYRHSCRSGISGYSSTT